MAHRQFNQHAWRSRVISGGSRFYIPRLINLLALIAAVTPIAVGDMASSRAGVVDSPLKASVDPSLSASICFPAAWMNQPTGAAGLAVSKSHDFQSNQSDWANMASDAAAPNRRRCCEQLSAVESVAACRVTLVDLNVRLQI